jgi:hypothetical protein
MYIEARTWRLGTRLIILRAPGDEASLILAASALVERLGRTGIGALQRFVVPVVLTLIGLVLLVMSLGAIALMAFGVSWFLGGPDIVGGMRWGELAGRVGLLEYSGLAAATGLAVVLTLPMVVAMVLGGVAFGLDAGLLSPWLVSRAEESPSGKERIWRFERRPDHQWRSLLRRLRSTDVFGIFTRFYFPVLKDSWRSEALAHTEIHDDPRVAAFVAEEIAKIEKRADVGRG